MVTTGRLILLKILRKIGKIKKNIKSQFITEHML